MGQQTSDQIQKRVTWSSERVFLFAVIGGAVGVGNLWRFPYLVGENGGGTFICVYIISIIALSLPLKMAEVALGKAGRASPVLSFRNIAKEAGGSKSWSFVGWSMSFSMFLLLSFYAVIGGWSLKYAILSFSGELVAIDKVGASSVFNTINDDPFTLGMWHLIFLVITTFIVSRGIKSGLEKAFKKLVPALLIILVALVIWAAITADFRSAVNFLFHFDSSKLSWTMVLEAVGQAFFSLGVGAGIFMAYGSYVPPGTSVPKTMLITGIMDTFVALIAGLAIFPFVFAYGLSVAQGPGLFFLTLPLAFGAMPYGSMVGFMFFTLIFIAALSSSIGMLEVSISRFKEIWPNARGRIACFVGILCWMIGVTSVLSFSVLKGVEPLGFINLFAGMNIFETFNYFLGNIVGPVNGLLIAIFCGWILKAEKAKEILDFKSSLHAKIWLMLVKYLVPITLFLVIIGIIIQT